MEHRPNHAPPIPAPVGELRRPHHDNIDCAPSGDRDLLLQQLLDIGSVTDLAARRHVAAYERGFLSIFGTAPVGLGPSPKGPP